MSFSSRVSLALISSAVLSCCELGAMGWWDALPGVRSEAEGRRGGRGPQQLQKEGLQVAPVHLLQQVDFSQARTR